MLASPYEAVWRSLPRTNASGVSGLWEAVAACFAALQLVGYMMLAVVVGSPRQELRINITVSTVTAFVFVAPPKAIPPPLNLYASIINICLPAAFSVCYALAGILIYREYGRYRAEGTPLLTDEEMQRRQLLRLLGERSTNAPSPDLVRNTYRFDLPEGRAQKDWSHLTP
ncbi:hypothetical protein PEX1_102310 [Penicillium expansum]|uniref:Uncharacterized protein n=1 Tax=Penicillium expansum TaxID=27334 RepID=A0A0A2IEI8_PENEN|nr:hypothetical protein PEX2_039060 [Penicillium expansum]KGO38675.1 hypothetical protein PEXP_109530 [Penicillium expansum]KGO49318.1 hypothetical protein PEX1_102310 [Penicillium expansum]KGO54202.1 hypothetical protein PEX2_039060 [Penicillium expansum]